MCCDNSSALIAGVLENGLSFIVTVYTFKIYGFSGLIKLSTSLPDNIPQIKLAFTPPNAFGFGNFKLRWIMSSV